jgi:hypothetical protein
LGLPVKTLVPQPEKAQELVFAQPALALDLEKILESQMALDSLALVLDSVLA